MKEKKIQRESSPPSIKVNEEEELRKTQNKKKFKDEDDKNNNNKKQKLCSELMTMMARGFVEFIYFFFKLLYYFHSISYNVRAFLLLLFIPSPFLLFAWKTSYSILILFLFEHLFCVFFCVFRWSPLTRCSAWFCCFGLFVNSLWHGVNIKKPHKESSWVEIWDFLYHCPLLYSFPVHHIYALIFVIIVDHCVPNWWR